MNRADSRQSPARVTAIFARSTSPQSVTGEVPEEKPGARNGTLSDNRISEFSTRAKRRIKLALFLLTLLSTITSTVPALGAERPNVLFIAIDDLRPELGCYGQPVISPNIDALAESGTLFERAYVQVALCMPSRVSVLTGQRPDTTGVVDFSVRFRDVQPDVLTLPQHFLNNGYTAVAFGKIFHNDDKLSWSEPLWKSQRVEDDYHTEFGKDVMAWTKEDHRRLTYVWDLGDGITKTKRPGGLPWEAPEIPDNAVRDGQIAEAAVAKIEELRKRKLLSLLPWAFTNLTCPSSPQNASLISTIPKQSNRHPIPTLQKTPRLLPPTTGMIFATTTGFLMWVPSRPGKRGS